jgi:hypothetical protein
MPGHRQLFGLRAAGYRSAFAAANLGSEPIGAPLLLWRPLMLRHASAVRVRRRSYAQPLGDSFLVAEFEDRVANARLQERLAAFVIEWLIHLAWDGLALGCG